MPVARPAATRRQPHDLVLPVVRSAVGITASAPHAQRQDHETLPIKLRPKSPMTVRLPNVSPVRSRPIRNPSMSIYDVTSVGFASNCQENSTVCRAEADLFASPPMKSPSGSAITVVPV